MAKYKSRISNGLAEVRPNRPLYIWMSKFRNVERFFLKSMVVALDSKNPLALLPLSGEVGREVESFLNISQVGETNDEESEINEAHKNQVADQVGKREIPKEVGIREEQSWQESVELSEVKDEKLSLRIMRVLSNYAPM